MPSANAEQVLAFDFGLRHIGVAVGQSITASASPVTTLAATNGNPNWTEMQQLVDAWKPHRLVVGLPLNMDDTESDMSARARGYARQLQKRFDLPVSLVDERLSSREARMQAQELGKAGVHGSDHELAAVIIAQGYLGSR